MAKQQEAALNAAQLNLDDMWVTLNAGLEQIYAKIPMTSAKYMELYTGIYNYCTVNAIVTSAMPSKQRHNSELVGSKLYTRITDFFRAHVSELRKKAEGLVDNEEILRYYTDTWRDFQFGTKVANGVCAYLNRHWVNRELQDGGTVCEIYPLALAMWKEALFEPLHKQVTKAALQLIERERRGDLINSSLIKCVTDCYVELGGRSQTDPILDLYKQSFEAMFLSDTDEFYAAESQSFFNSFAEYMKKVEHRIKEEEKRVNTYLHTSTMTPLTKCFECEMIQRHSEMFQSEFQDMLSLNKNEDLRRMYVARVCAGLPQLRETFRIYVAKQGLAAIEKCGDTAINDPKMYVNTILEVYEKYHDLVLNAFKNDTGFITALDKACGEFINTNAVTTKAANSTKSPELLAKYCDLLLRKSAKNPEEAELEELLNQVMVVFKYIDDKDVFQKFYLNQLAKRLVGQLSGDDAESSMISKLKTACGYEYTSKLQKMFQDVGISKDLNEKFRAHLTNSEPLPVDFSVQVLTSVSWPFAGGAPFTAPAVLGRCQDHFATFYSNQFSGRKLSWLYHLSKAEIMANKLDKRYTFTTTTYQMAILLQYNDADEYSLQQICDSTQIKPEIVQQLVEGLIKFQLLSANDEELCAESRIEIAKNFTSKKMKHDISKQVIRSEKKEETEIVQKNVDEERKMLIQAAIVRIMKMRKTLKHTPLIAETLAQLVTRFKPKIPLVKKCIDILIEKEYIKRKENEKDTYEYIA